MLRFKSAATKNGQLQLKDELDEFDLVDQIDPIVWDAICHLTKSSKPNEQQGLSLMKKEVRRAYLIAQMMFTIDSRYAAPFHTQITDLVDCCGGSNELIRTLNRLGVCSSYDTLLRHIQEHTKKVSEKGLLQGLDPSVLTVFSIDNIDFLKSHAQVYCGNQKLSWHGTTLQGIQPLANIKDGQSDSKRRARDSSSPSHSPLLKKHRGRARTGTELTEQNDTTQSVPLLSDTYHFEDTSPNTSFTINMFRPSVEERSALSVFEKRLLHYCLLKDSYRTNKTNILESMNEYVDIDTTIVEMVHMQEFCALYDKHLQPDVADVVYVNVLDEKADDKDTVLNVINQLYNEHVRKQGKNFLVLEGDAKTYEIIQNIKEEYGKDLNWLYAYPGDWHLLKIIRTVL